MFHQTKKHPKPNLHGQHQTTANKRNNELTEIKTLTLGVAVASKHFFTHSEPNQHVNCVKLLTCLCQANICKRRNLRTSSAVGTANLWGSGFLCFSPKAFQAKSQASASFLSAWFATNVYLRQFLWKVH